MQDRLSTVSTLAAPEFGRRAMLGAWMTVGIFLFLYVFSFVDRTIMTMMVKEIKASLQISDFQMSLLLGPAFAIFYVLCGIPMGWLVDRLSARLVAFLGVVVWGAATFFGGFSTSALQLSISRTGVGVGEATLTPAAHSEISELFPARWLSTALSVYTLGVILGTGLALVAGGAVVSFVSTIGVVTVPVLGAVQGWQLVFLIVGAATLLVSPLALASPRIRHRRAEYDVAADAQKESLWAYFSRNRTLLIALPVGFGLVNIITNAFGSWVPSFMIRNYGYTQAEVGVAYGTTFLIAGSIGQIGGAMVVDWLYARGWADAHVKYMMIGLFLTIPCAVIGIFSGVPVAFLVLMGVFWCFTFPFVGYAAAALQLGAPQHLRGRISAYFLAVVTLIGSLLGPTLTAGFTDYVFHDEKMLGPAMAIVAVISAPLAWLVLSIAARAMRARALAGVRPTAGEALH